MKINVITVFKSENCGSFLQAWALKETLSSMGNDVCFCDYKNIMNSHTRRMSNVMKCCLRFRFQRARGILKKTADFKRFQKKLKVVSPEENAADIYFFGSDTLWNFDDKFFEKNTAFFTGANVKKPCYTYSISVGSASEAVLLKNDAAVKNIQKFKRIAVRDAHSENVISKIYPAENIERTVDPTLLFDKERYIQSFSTKPVCNQKSLVVYYFGTIPGELWKGLQVFAKKKDLKIVNVGAHEDQFNLSVVPSPANFITAFANAEYIFTNTFHGCVFSTIFNKQFATNGIHKKKIEGYLKQFSLLDRCVSAPEDVERVLTMPVDYELVNSLIKQAREASVKYLNNAIEENHE